MRLRSFGVELDSTNTTTNLIAGISASAALSFCLWQSTSNYYHSGERMSFYSITELADRYGVAPKAISDLFFRRLLDPDRCIVKAGRKLIPSEYVPHVERALRRAGRLRSRDAN